MRPSYPESRRDDVVDDYHGTAVPDPYRWLEDAASPETCAWIGAQNALTRAWLDEVAGRERLRDRVAELWDHPRRGAPWRRGDRWFQFRNTGLQQQDVLWTMAGPGDEGRVLYDPNEEGDGTTALAAAAASRDGNTLAYATSEAGSDWMSWRLLDVATGRPAAEETLRWVKFSGAAWVPEGSGFFYARYDQPPEGQALAAENRDQKLCFHRVGTEQEADAVVYARPDQPEWGFEPEVTEDGRYLVVSVWHGTDHRNRVVYAELEGFDPRRPEDLEVRELLMDFDAGYHVVDHLGGVLLFRTDHDAPRGRVIGVPLDDPRPGAWTEVVPQTDATLERVQRCGDHLVGVELHDARHRLTLHTLQGRPDGTIPLPGVGTVGELAGRPGDPVLHFTVTTFTAPSAVYQHNLETGVTRAQSDPGLAIDPGAYETEQVFVESTDGVGVPMFLVRRAGLPRGDVPTLLYGYGGFGIPVTPAFSVSWLVWLELGGQLAVANLRGGGEYGEQWHAAGRGERKQQVFDDAVACAEWLIAEGWTTSRRLVITGASNGGLLAGACLTQRPDLFGACVPEVGVLDMLRFHRFTIGWAWISDYGSADIPEQFKVLLAYSPLHNLASRPYPATLVVTGDHDDRVVPAHSFKFTAALQVAQTGDAPILVRVQTEAGHGAGKPTLVRIEERADVLAFLVRALDMEVPG